jgi:hypothetical protein
LFCGFFTGKPATVASWKAVAPIVTAEGDIFVIMRRKLRHGRFGVMNTRIDAIVYTMVNNK